MPSGILGKADLVAAIDTEVYSVPSGKTSACTINICNRSDVAVKIRISVSDTVTPSGSEYIEYDVLVPSKGVLERAGIVLNASKKIIVRSDVSSVTAVVWGYEE